MNKKQWSNKSITLLTVLSISTVISGCGGGSSTDASNDTSTNVSQVQIDTSNQKQVLASLFDSVDITTPQLPSIDSASADASLGLTSTGFTKTLPNYKSLAVASPNEPYTCSEGGSINATVSGEVSTITYDNCKEAGTTTNGQIKVAYNATSQEITYTMTNYSIVSENSEYTTSSTIYTVSADSIKYISTGKAIHEGSTIEFNDYSYALSLVDNKVNISINGSIKTSCLGNWVTVKTNQPMQLTDNTCPAAGEIEVQGDNSTLRVKFSEDKSVDIFMNDTLTKEYTTCDELPETSGVCGV